MLGKGAQARVYLAWDSRLKQWRALKVLAQAHLDDEHIKSRFDGEAQMMAKLSHLNLLRVLDVAADGHIPFMVMELARGGSIVDWMKRNGALPPRMAVDVAIQCCHGLEHSHAQGIVHRDVKPHNILVQEEGRAVLTDFGIARADDAVQLTADGAAMGTFAFMAPEQRSDAHNVDERADVYALGTSLYTMLTLRTSAELFIAEEKDKILDGVPKPLRKVIVAACKYERDERVQTMRELRGLLEQALTALPEDAPSKPLFEEIIPLPPEVPNSLPADSGVEDLLKMMVSAEDQPTTLLTGSTGRTDPDRTVEDMQTAIPYQMPDIREIRKKAQSMPPRPKTADREPDEVPDYIDQSTLPPSRAEQMREIREIGIESPEEKAKKEILARREAKRAPPPPAPKPKARIPWIRIGLLGTSMMALMFIVLLMGVSYSAKSSASMARREATTALVNQVIQDQSVVENLVSEGGDAKRLQDAWFALKDATPEAKPAAALQFARVSVAEADRVGAHGKAGAQVHQIRTKLDDWDAADAAWKIRATSGLGRLTGSLGVY
ncbi:MAG: serine/threonine protein kinase [Myxococcales bacterium]|nr:serine/threonine protein kinase [Myxococcales bacterium]